MVFLSDYGLRDEFVGIVHRVVSSVAPAVRVIDLTHLVPPHRVRAGALTLWRCAPWLHDSVVLAVVDPGVGTPRRPVAIEIAGSGTVLVGPDNGLLLPAAHALGPITSAVHLAAPRSEPSRPPGSGSTFDGRDLFAPVAARIASGELAAGNAGDPIDPGSLIGDPVPSPVQEEGGGVRCEVLWVDRFGNAQLNARPADLAHLGDPLGVVTHKGGSPREARQAAAFGDLGDGELGLVTDSYGLVALSFNASPAAECLGIREEDSVWLGPAADG
ncbi:MAG TPA: SAM-dependent chlorinase/fluorinase [Acidimicrobiales bacterium]|nr:SAM-dependent chlorinase/fluorinase [Acidimicrobiales bacterium]